MLGAAIGFVAGSIFRYRRAHVEESMQRASIATVHARAMYRRLGRALVDLITGAANRVVLAEDLIRAIDEARERGPVILFASHTGNWEHAAAAAASRWPLRVVAKPMSVRWIDALVKRMRARLGVKTIAPEGALHAALSAFRDGEIVVMPIDQVPQRKEHGVRVTFLDQTTLADRAPATLAWRTHATAIVVAATEQTVHFLGSMAPAAAAAASSSSSSSSSAWIADTTRTATALLETFIRTNPASWMWLHRRWKAPRERKGRTTRTTAPEASLTERQATT